ncbi:MAG: hypothetical protein AAF152_05760 [Cyanobacteria bacterium P01_A01_bin.114]
MDAKLTALFTTLQKPGLTEADYQSALSQLVDAALRSRKIGRPLKGQFPAPLYRNLYESLHNQVLKNLTLEHNSNGGLAPPGPLSWGEWAERQQLAAARTVLTDDCLNQLALSAQQYPGGGELRQYALSELIQALLIVKQADAIATHSSDILHRTLSYVCDKIDQFNPQKGPVIAWVNYQLKLTPSLIRQEQADKVVQASRRKLFRTRLMLKRLLREASPEALRGWISLYLKARVAKPVFLAGLIPLVYFRRLAHLNTLDSSAVDTFLFDLAAAVIHTSPKISFVDPAAAPLENISPASNTLSDEIRQYLETDPDQILKKHIQGCHRATFQTIALARLDGQRWGDLADQFGVAVPTLSSFYERYLKQIAPQIKQYVQL